MGEGRYVSPGVLGVTGFNAEEYLALKDLDFMHPEERPQARASIDSLRAGHLSPGEVTLAEATLARSESPAPEAGRATSQSA